MSRKAVEWARANCGMYSTIGSNITIEALSLERLIDQLTAAQQRVAELEAERAKLSRCCHADNEHIDDLTAHNARLRVLLRELCKSFECYAALNKPEKDWDEYDHMMNPVWQRANKELGQ